MSEVRFPRDATDELLKYMTTTGTWGSLPEQEKLDATMAAQSRANLTRVRPIPNRGHLEAILDVVYIASLMEEEGRRINFTLAYLGEEGARALKHEVFPFNSPSTLWPPPRRPLPSPHGRGRMGNSKSGGSLITATTPSPSI
jgi:hypothetical protein